MSNQLQITGGAKVRALEGVITGTSGVLSSVPYGGANGVATLDSGGKVPVSQLPSSVVTYLGTWNAATNTPYLVNGTGDAGDLYICNVAGTANFGAGPITFAVGDWVLYGSGTWQKSSGQNGTVTSVAASITGNSLGITGSPITTAGTLAFAFAGTNLQYVNGAGNLTTFPSLTGFVPYTGATGDVNLGLFDLKTAKLWLYDVPNAGYGSLELTDGVLHFEDADGHSMVTMEDGYLTIANASTIRALLNVSGLSANRDYAFPNASGTLALTSDLSGYVTLATAQTISGDKIFTGINSFDYGINYKTGASLANVSGYISQAYATSGTGAGSTLSLKISDGNSVKAINLDFVGSPATYTYTFPAASGTLALTSNLSSYVPYTGATTNVDLGSNDLTSYAVKANILEASLNGTASSPLILRTGTSGFASGLNAISLISSPTSANTLTIISNASSLTKTAQIGIGSLTATRTYTLPDASGTVALTSNLSSYVPYTGATTSVNLGLYDLTALYLAVSQDGDSVGGYINFKQCSSVNNGSIGNTNIFAKNSTQFGINYMQSSGLNKTAIFDASSITTGNVRTFTFPDASGTLALTSSLSGYLPLTGGTLTGQLYINPTNTATVGLDVASDTIRFRSDNLEGYKRQLEMVMGSGTLIQLTAKGYGGTYGTDLAFYTSSASGVNGSPAMYITGGNKIGILNGSPNYTFDITGNFNVQNTYALDPLIRLATTTSGNVEVQLRTATTTYNPSIGVVTSGYDFGLFTNNTTRMTITSGGNVGIGTSTPRNKLDVSGSIFVAGGSQIQITGNSGATGLQLIGQDSDISLVGTMSAQALVFRTDSTERMRITSGGDVFVGFSGSAAGQRLRTQGASATGSDYAFVAANSTTASLFFIRNDGFILTGSAAASPYNLSTTGRSAVIESNGALGYLVSTRESKANIKSIENVDFVNQLNPVSFNYRKKDYDTNTFTNELYDNITYGFIADEVEKVNKDLVFYTTDGKLAGVEYNNMIAILTKAIQELSAQVEELKNK
jgi:hypothetical protein